MPRQLVHQARSVPELRDGFHGKIEAIKTCVGLVGAGDHESVQLMQLVRRDLDDIRQRLAQLRASLADGQRDVERCSALIPALAALNDRLMHMRQHLPARLPRSLQQERPKPDLTAFGSSSACYTRPDCSEVPSSVKCNAAEPLSPAVPQFQYITVTEFEEVPKYIRLRLQYDQINRVVEELNKALVAKYTLLRRPRAKLSLPDMKLVNALRGQGNDSTKGRAFVVADDLKRWSGVAVDASTRSALTVLRTARKCQEIRGPASLVRYVVPQGAL